MNLKLLKDKRKLLGLTQEEFAERIGIARTNYLKKEKGRENFKQEQIDKMRRLEEKKLPADVDYCTIKGLRLEAQEKLNKFKPLNVGQAGRISGVNPADVSVLLIWLASQEKGAQNG